MKFISLLFLPKFKNIKISIIIFNILFAFFVVFIMVNSRIVQSSIKEVISLYLRIVIPALLPFLLITELLITSNKVLNLSYGINRFISKLFRINRVSVPCVVMGFLLGYPNAAKYITKLYENGEIDHYEAKKLVAFTSNANMGYVISAVGISMIGNYMAGIILLISHFLSAIIIGIIYKPKSNINIIQQSIGKSNTLVQKNIQGFNILITSIKNVTLTLANIFFFMVIFSTIPEAINNITKLDTLIYNFILSILEITSGIDNLAKSHLSFNTMMLLISFAMSFSSIMIIIQVYSFVYKCKIKFKSLLIYKFIQGILSMAITYLLLIVIKQKSLEVFYNYEKLICNNYHYCNFLIIYIMFVFILFSFIVLRKRKAISIN